MKKFALVLLSSLFFSGLSYGVQVNHTAVECDEVSTAESRINKNILGVTGRGGEGLVLCPITDNYIERTVVFYDLTRATQPGVCRTYTMRYDGVFINSKSVTLLAGKKQFAWIDVTPYPTGVSGYRTMTCSLPDNGTLLHYYHY